MTGTDLLVPLFLEPQQCSGSTVTAHQDSETVLPTSMPLADLPNSLKTRDGWHLADDEMAAWGAPYWFIGMQAGIQPGFFPTKTLLLCSIPLSLDMKAELSQKWEPGGGVSP